MRRIADLSVHDRLKAAVLDLERAEKNAVTLFALVMRRRLYRELGHGTILLYAMKELGFSKSKTHQFIRLAESLESLPALKREVAKGAVPWTKAREVAKVATKQTEHAWIGVAKRSSRRELERSIAATRAEARAGRRSDRAQTTLPGRSRPNPQSTLTDAAGVPTPATLPSTVTLRFSAEEFARLEALEEAARKRGIRVARTALLLAALEDRVTEAEAERTRAPGKCAPGSTAGDGSSRVSARSPYHVTVSLCPRCRTASMPTSRGDATLDEAATAAVLSDCERIGPDKRRRASIPPRVRRAVFERDGHRCQTPGKV